MDLRLFYLGVTLLWVHTAQCQSNRAPNWVEDLSNIISIQGLREGLPIGSEIGTLIAEDPENDPVSYTTTSDTFNVDRTSGLVTLAKNLDYESTDQNLKVQFVASDNLNNRSPVDLNVAIIDVNDNPPVFLNSENYNSKVREDAAVGEVLTNDQNAVRIRDVDTQENAKVTLRCYYQSLRDVQAYEACQMFNVTEVKVDTGVYLAKITLNKPLDFETKRSYTLTMRATDGVHEDYKNFVIEVEDVQDSLPRFFNTPITFNVTENAPAGTSIYTLYAEDQDLGNPNPLNIKLISDPLGFFTLQQGTPEGSRYSAVVKSSGRIDREKLGTSSNYVILAQAVEMENGVEISTHVNTTIMVQVVDLNDNRPQFDHEVYVVNVTEGLRLNTPLPNLDIRVTDADQGSNARFNLSILQDPYGTFSLSPVETQQREARPTLIVANEDNMDYDSETRGFRNQQIVLKAQGFDGSFDTATVLVNLIDINDNSPTFSSPIYDLKLREDQPLNVPLDVTIKASDKDSGIFGQVRYNISGDGQEKFYINPSSGTLSLVSPLSIDSGVRAYHIQVTATDGGGEFDRVPLYVTVLDNNDNAPVFDTRTYRTSVMEDDTSLDPPITVKAEDTDAGSDIGYNITQGNTADAAFQLDPVSGVLTLTRGLRMTDTPGGTGLFRLTVQATELSSQPQVALATVEVTIIDKNDFPPVFSPTDYTGNVTEITAPLTPVVRLLASDQDEGQNGNITYRIFTGHKDNFAIDSRSGVLSVAPKADLDRDVYGDKYSIIVLAVDAGIQRKTGTATVQIYVADANNRNPYFERETHLGRVKENAAIGTSVLQVTAQDEDSSADLRYTILQDTYTAKDRNGRELTASNFRNYFSIDSRDGTVRTAVNRYSQEEVAEITFMVEVQDYNAEKPADQRANTTVFLIIQQTQGGNPTFDAPWSEVNPKLYFSLSESSTGVGAEVTTLGATDPSDGSRITNFEKVPSSDPLDYFVVDRTSGRVTLKKILDYDAMVRKEVNVLVRAIGKNITQFSTAELILRVTDANDNNPVFLERGYSFSISENPNSVFIGRVQASDKDDGDFGRVFYSISGQGADNFYINPQTGEIRLADGATLDRETTQEYTLIVSAADNANGSSTSRNDEVSLKIKVIDYNDHAPEFERSVYQFFKYDNLEAQRSIGVVSAKDNDEGNNGQIIYTINSGNENGMFQLDPQTGLLTSGTPLTGRARDQPYILQVKAEDRGSPIPLSNYATIQVTIRPSLAADSKPRFEVPERDGVQFNITENTAPNTFVTQVIASDPDSGEAGVITYQFLSGDTHPDHQYFRIGPASGRIVTTDKVLDRETKEVYELIVIARDNGVPPQEAHRRLLVRLRDLDDNQPTFRDCRDLRDPVTVSVMENQPPETEVAIVEGCDADLSPNNVMAYRITCGDSEVFSLDPNSGRLATKRILDRELQASYELCIQVLDPSRDTPVATSGSAVIRYIINVLDEDDEPPRFDRGTGKIVTTTVLDTALYHSEVTKVYAHDPDLVGKDKILYSITDINYVRNKYPPNRDVRSAFIIDKNTGMIRTNFSQFTDFINGFFNISVQVRDAKNRRDTAQVLVYVIKDYEKLKFVFDEDPNKVKDKLDDFLKELVPIVGFEVKPDDISHHVDENGNINANKTDVCFHAVKGSEVKPKHQTRKELQNSQNYELQRLYALNGVSGVENCVNPTALAQTTNFGGYSWLWWLLVALAALLILLAIIGIILLCCCWNSYQKAAGAPYIPEATNPVLYSREMEWQEGTMSYTDPGPGGYGNYTYQVQF